jgi:predicted dehydrogenase
MSTIQPIDRVNRPINVLMVGIAGYGYCYLKTLLDRCSPDEVQIVGAVEPYAERAELSDELKTRGIPVFSSLEDFYAEGRKADLTVIASPLHFHVPQSILALQNGSHVLCDKPVGVTVQEVDRLISQKNAGNKEVLVGFQWSYSRAIQELKSDIQRGLWGKPMRLKTLCFWPRDLAYYQRNDWSGKIRDPDGRWILDSPAHNAMAHFLHNLLYLLGDRPDTSAVPAKIKAEAYRAFPIENYDTTACRVWTCEGTELLFYASHAVSRDWGPMFLLDFEEATISFGETGQEIIARDLKGSEKRYGSPEDDDQFKKLFDAIHVAQGRGEVVCGPEASRSQVVCVNGIQDSVAKIIDLPQVLVHRSSEGKIAAKAVEQSLTICYQRGVLPSESNQSWVQAGEPLDLSSYVHFPANQTSIEKELT